MTEIPEAAIEAAAEELFYAEDEALGYPRELRRWEAQYPDQDGDWHDYWRDRARVTLKAATPIIRAQVAAEIRAKRHAGGMPRSDEAIGFNAGLKTAEHIAEGVGE